MSEPFVIVHRSSDPFQADILGAILRDNGIAARVLGTRHGAAIGVGQHILELHIEVPQSQAGAATDFLEAYFEQDGEALLAEQMGLSDDDADEGDDAAGPEQFEAPGTGSGSAALATLILFGGSHAYTRRFVTAVCLAAGQAYALLAILLGASAPLIDGVAMAAALLAGDLIGGQLAARARRQGRVVAPWTQQLAVGALLVAGAGAVGAWFAHEGQRAPRAYGEAPSILLPAPQQPVY
ncbi:hypothetical protein [Haliangium sp.]|uniref:hypothetical protein n=1 Tax=Haliangium sp. TaxID=2663208 RepID=UPI003D0FEAE2